MAERHSHLSRRTVLKTAGVLAVGGVSATGVGAAQQDYDLRITQYPEEEYVVIANVGDSDADITGYSINFEAEDDDYNQVRELAGEVVIATGDSITVPTGAREVTADNIVELADPYEGEVLNNDGSDVVALLDPDGNEVASTNPDGPVREAYTVTFNIELLDNVPDDLEIPPLELDIGDEGQLSGDWIYDGGTIQIAAGTYDFGGGIYPYPDEQIASNFYIAERPGVIDLDSDREVTYVFGYDDPDDDDGSDDTDDGGSDGSSGDRDETADSSDDNDNEDGAGRDGSSSPETGDSSGSDSTDEKDCPSR